MDNAIDALTNHIRTVINGSSQTVPANSDRKELPRDVKELIRTKNTALRRASKYPTCENRSHAPSSTLQRKVRNRMQGYRNDNRVSLPPKDNLDPITQDEVGKHIKVLKIRKAPGVDTIINRPIRAGVPQSSTLSPLLYSAYINDIPRPKTGVQLTLFADNTALFLRSNCLRKSLPCLQRAIDELTQ
ncbi:Probable RNA-directed DNA polymerase from transposon BS [Eumeta japonica]|uniref:Probable RNA-directed DNA polymerase from transposon BS n=1 Tax=Eumeta variegata TaxID=151549 RepID=A0A4C1TQK9_EUMVA|nr:Probable RNA-directed DNA polymerase from transposon BS [Eumeta japonica]